MSEEEEEIPEAVEEIRITKEVIQDSDNKNEPEKTYNLSPELYEDNDLTESTKQLIKREIDDLFNFSNDQSNTETTTKINKNGDEIITTTTTTKTEVIPTITIEKKNIDDIDNEDEPEKKIKISESPNSKIVKETVIKKKDNNGDVIEITKETISKVKNEEHNKNEILEKNDNKNDHKNRNLRKNNIIEKKVEVIRSSNEPVIEKIERRKNKAETNYKKNDNDFKEVEKPKPPEKVATSRIMKSKRLQYKLKNKKIEEKDG